MLRVIISSIRFFFSAKPHQLLTSFSIYTNGKNLFQTTTNSEHIKTLDGMRVLSLYWVVITHFRTGLADFSINSFHQFSVRYLFKYYTVNKYFYYIILHNLDYLVYFQFKIFVQLKIWVSDVKQKHLKIFPHCLTDMRKEKNCI